MYSRNHSPDVRPCHDLTLFCRHFTCYNSHFAARPAQGETSEKIVPRHSAQPFRAEII